MQQNMMHVYLEYSAALQKILQEPVTLHWNLKPQRRTEILHFDRNFCITDERTFNRNFNDSVPNKKYVRQKQPNVTTKDKHNQA